MLTVFLFLAVALAVATASITLTRARIFEPWRTWLQPRSWFWYKLASCPYCMAHWLALGATLVLPDLVQTGWSVTDWLITCFALTGAAALFEAAITRGLLMTENRILELEAALEALEDEKAAAIDRAYGNGLVDGQKQERERYAAMEVRLRQPIT